MTDAEVRQYLEDNGYPAHIVQGGLPGLVRRWKEFVAEVEQGYPFGLEDYRNDLDVRGILQLVGADSEAEVADADSRLQALLTNQNARVWESVAQDPWWDFGHPANARGALRRDLMSEGLWATPAD